MRTEEEYLKLANELLKKKIEILELRLKEKEATFKFNSFPDSSHAPGAMNPSAFPIILGDFDYSTINPCVFPGTTNPHS